MNPFEAYAERARIIAKAPPPMLGPNKTRADARVRYQALVAEIAALNSADGLEAWLTANKRELAQFAAALEFMWTGDGSGFRGLKHEIEWARARVDDRLDFPRWEPKPDFQTETGA